MKLNFLDEGHEERYIKICEKNAKCLNDREYMTAAYMLSISQSVFDKAISYFSDKGIYFDDLYMNQDLTPAICFYIQVTDSLFRWKEIQLNLSDINRLDYPHLFGVFNGIKIYTDYDHRKKGYEDFQKMIETIQ
ncbi:hypothetical protein [Traorella massiliensis]|uniref:hypothetical protein n=1 Tax=Traorella massiliensis TaxID=1903263 RepID=UPI0008F8F2F8|nr:hypothetical protein [Traorella massiliensis]